jgi:hypothetical protein
MQILTKDLRKFFILTFLATWIFWVIPVLNSHGVIDISISNDLFRIVGSFGPSVIGIIFLVKKENKSINEILKNVVSIRGNFKWILYMFLLMPCLLAIAYVIARFGFKSSYELELLNNPILIPIAFIYILVLGGPLGEEIGWRGYALNKLLKIHTPFLSSIILALIWAIWHIPLFYIKGTAQEGLSFFAYIINVIILSIFMTILHIKTDKSIFTAIIFHTTANLSIGIFTIYTNKEGLISIFIVYLVAVITVIYLSRNLLFKKAKEEIILSEHKN